MNAEAWNDLMSAAGATPRLERAACRGATWMADLGEKSDPDALERAEATCYRCPQRAACSAWVDRLEPHMRPAGYAAGRLLGLPPAPPKVKRDPADDDRWLREHLVRRGGRVVAEQVLAAGVAAGIPETRLKRVRVRAGVVLAGGQWCLDGAVS
jgi:hypothetical protein